MRRLQSALGVALLSCSTVTPLAYAEEIEASLTTLVSGRQDARDGRRHTAVPILELVSIRVRSISVPWLSDVKMVLTGWGRVDPADPVDQEYATGDIGIATIEGTALRGRLSLRGGRQLVIGGAARNSQFDGLSAEYRVWKKLGVTAYGGHPVTREFELNRGDAIAGTRLYWRDSIRSEVGLSVIHLRDNGAISRQDVSLDGRYAATKSLVTSAYALWSTTEARIAELDAATSWQAHRHLRLTANYRRVAPDLFLSRTSILSVFSEENRDELGGAIYFHPLDRLRLLTDAAYVSLEAGSGFRAGAKASLFLGVAGHSRLAAELRVFDTPGNRYYRSRISANQRLGSKASLSLDADAYRLQESINGKRLSLTGTATASYSIYKDWHATAVGIAGSTPFFKRRLEVMAKLVWGQVRRVREVTR